MDNASKRTHPCRAETADEKLYRLEWLASKESAAGNNNDQIEMVVPSGTYGNLL